RHRSRGRSTGGGGGAQSISTASRGSKSSFNDHRSRGSGDNRSRKSSHTTDDNRSHNKRRGQRRGHGKKHSSSSRSRSEEQQWEGSTTPLDSAASTNKSPSSTSSLHMAPIPNEAKRALARIRGGEALPRESVVSSVVRKLVSRIDRRRRMMMVANAGNDDVDVDGEEDGNSGCCVAILSSPLNHDVVVVGDDNGDVVGGANIREAGAGEGKTTIAALTCIRGDIRTRYHQGIAWLDCGGGDGSISEPSSPSPPPLLPLHRNFDTYSKALSDICRQIGVRPQQLRLSPVVRTPGEDETVSELRIAVHMREARARMGKLLTSLQQRKSKPRGSKDGNSQQHQQQHTSVLIVLDDVTSPLDIEWFQFRRNGNHTDGEQLNDLLITSRLSTLLGNTTNNRRQIIIPITVPPLDTKEAIRLLLTESDLPGNHPSLAASHTNRVARSLVKACLFHPLTIKFAGRWLGLKRATSGGQKGIDEILGEIHDAISGKKQGGNTNGSNNTAQEAAGGHHATAVDVLYSLLHRAMSPLVKGQETKIVRLCFVALIAVFYGDDTTTTTSSLASDISTTSSLVPMEIATDFFLNVVENERDILSKEDTFFQSNGRQASKLVPEILGALGVFNITKHTTLVEGSSERNESSIQIDHDVIRQFSRRIIHEDTTMSHLLLEQQRQQQQQQQRQRHYHPIKRWNEAYVQSYFAQKTKYLWDDIQPDRSRKYALKNMPRHMINAEMFIDVEELLLRNESFIRGRFWSLGWTEGTRVHVNDVEEFCRRLQLRQEEQEQGSIANSNNNGGDGSSGSSSSSKLVDACKQLEVVLMEEVARESGGPNGRCSTLEAGRCLHEISVSLAKFKLWHDAARFCDSCVELVESNLGSSELVASLLHNSSVMHAEANEYDEAEKKIGDCLDMRVKTCGTESILYVRALCQLGDILSVSSDYSAAESCFNKSIGILKVMPAQYHLDFGVALFKLGRNQHRRGGYLDEAMHCYEDALEFEKEELGPRHSFVFNILMHMAEILLDKEDMQQAKHTFKEALDVLSGGAEASSELKSKVAIAEGKLLSIEGQSDECVDKYQFALDLLKKHTPAKKRKIAQINALIGAELEKKGKYPEAECFYEECVGTIKSVFGPFHLDLAETLVNLSGVKSALGEVKDSAAPNCEHHTQATKCLEEAIDIQKSRLGDCEECAITLSIFGAHLKSIGAYERAELAYNDAVRILQALEGDQELSLADALLGLADLMTVRSKYSDAMEYYSQCQEIQESVFGQKHDDIASTLYAMGLAKHAEGSYSHALILFAKSLVMRVELHGEAHPSVGDTYDILGFVEAKTGNLDTALRRLTEALKIRKTLGDQLKEADTLNNIGNLHRERNEFELALQRHDECMNIRISVLGRNDESVADTLMALGNVNSDMEKPQEALSHYREGPKDASVASVFQKVGMVQYRAGNLESGRLFLEQAVEIYRQGGNENESKLITPLFIIGTIHNTLLEAEEAQRVWNDAFEMSKKIGEQSNPEVHRVLTQLLHAH
ncbi:hypothetical protein ACHAXR_008373, partial [Thalassiosira sp. AJA248-18]